MDRDELAGFTAHEMRKANPLRTHALLRLRVEDEQPDPADLIIDEPADTPETRRVRALIDPEDFNA
jgi:hypothetical protein